MPYMIIALETQVTMEVFTISASPSFLPAGQEDVEVESGVVKCGLDYVSVCA